MDNLPTLLMLAWLLPLASFRDFVGYSGAIAGPASASVQKSRLHRHRAIVAGFVLA
jgi:hypothetical protein